MIITGRANMLEALKQFVYGLTGYEFSRYALETRRELESIFIIVTLGDLIGVPVLPPVYSMRLLPHMAPEIEKWKRQMARRKEFWEREEFDLQGV
jgi:hypothetical protein